MLTLLLLIKKLSLQVSILIITLLGLLVFTFTLQRASPIDPVLKLVGDKASDETYNQVKAELGLDKPLFIQFYDYLSKILSGDFGVSNVSNQSILSELLAVFPATLEITVLSVVIGSFLGITLGLLSAHYANRPIDNLIRLVILPGIAMPAFLLGIIFISLFYVHLDWLPIGGKWSMAIEYQFPMDFNWTHISLIDGIRSPVEGALIDAILHLMLPVSLLSYFTLCTVCRMTRSAALEELSKEYVALAKVTGNNSVQIFLRHVVPNIKNSLIIVIALHFTHLLEGAVLTEVVFSWPGMGRYLKEAFLASNHNAIIGGTLIIGSCFVMINMFTEKLTSNK